jgi:hypothetical protein
MDLQKEDRKGDSMRSRIWLGFLAVLTACGQTTAPEQELHHRFGAVVARVNGQAWSSNYPMDGAIAGFDPQIGRLTIRASRYINSVHKETIVLSTCPVAGQSVYDVGPIGSRTYGYWISGGVGGSRSPLTPAGHYASVGAEGDMILLSALELDAAASHLEGQFRLTVRMDGEEPVVLSGSFAGAVPRRGLLPICD